MFPKYPKFSGIQDARVGTFPSSIEAGLGHHVPGTAGTLITAWVLLNTPTYGLAGLAMLANFTMLVILAMFDFRDKCQ